jgi:hypothetical protein
MSGLICYCDRRATPEVQKLHHPHAGSVCHVTIRMLSLLSNGHAPEFLKEIFPRRSDAKANIRETYS